MGNEIVDTAGSYISSSLSIGSNVLVWSTIILFIVGIIFLIYWIFSFKHIVVIKEKVGEAYHSQTSKLGFVKDYKLTKEKDDDKLITDKNEEEIKIIPTINSIHKAKIIIKKKQAYISLFSPNKKLKLPDNLYQSLTKKGKKWIELLKVNEHLYYPVYIKEDSKGATNYIYDMEVLNWAVQDVEEDYKKYNDLGFWDKYGSIVIVGGTLAICFLLVIVTFKYSNGIVDKMAPLAESFAAAAKQLANAQSTQVIGK